MDLFFKNSNRKWSRGATPTLAEIEVAQIQTKKSIEESSKTITPILMTGITVGLTYAAWRLGIVGEAHRK